MSNRYLRLTIDVVVFDEDMSESGKRTVKEIVREGKGEWGVGEKLAREFMGQIEAGRIEIDDIRNVEVH